MKELFTFGFDPDLHTAASAIIRSIWSDQWEPRGFSVEAADLYFVPEYEKGLDAVAAMAWVIGHQDPFLELDFGWVEYTAVYSGEGAIKDALGLLHLVSGMAQGLVMCRLQFVEPKTWMWKAHKPQNQADILRLLELDEIPVNATHGELGRNLRAKDKSHPIDAAGLAIASARKVADMNRTELARARLSALREGGPRQA